MAIAKKVAKPAKKSATSAKSAVQATVTLKHLAAALADSHEIAKKQAEAVLGDLVTLTTRHLKRGDKIRLTGLGILQVRKRAARTGRNPAIGEASKIKASKKIAFRAAKGLKWQCYRILAQKCWPILAHPPSLNLRLSRSDRGAFCGLESQSGIV